MRKQNAATALADSFGRSALRQPVFAILLFMPPLMGLFVRLLLVLLRRFLPAFDPVPWIPLFLGVSAGFPPYMYGLLAALMLLDERDRELLPAFRVTPLSDRVFMAAKVVPAMLLSMVGVPLCLYLSGQANLLPVWSPVAMGLIAAPMTAFYVLLVTGLATSKVQALTLGKILGTVLIAPVGLALFNSPWRLLLLIFPSSWMGAVLLGDSGYIWAIGAFVYALFLATVTSRMTLRNYFA